MKTYKTSVYPSQHELFELFKEHVPERFSDKIKKELQLTITETAEGIEIGIPEFYETYLYKIKVVGSEVHAAKSEHYIDDVNNLALEDIIDETIVDYLGVNHIETILQP